MQVVERVRSYMGRWAITRKGDAGFHIIAGGGHCCHGSIDMMTDTTACSAAEFLPPSDCCDEVCFDIALSVVTEARNPSCLLLKALGQCKPKRSCFNFEYE